MDKQMMEKMEKQFCGILEELSRKGLNSTSDVSTAKNAISAILKIKAINAMDKADSEGYGEERSYRRGRSYENGGRSYDNSYDNSYDGNSYRSYDGQSYFNQRSGHDLKSGLERLMNNGASESERKAIREVMEML